MRNFAILIGIICSLLFIGFDESFAEIDPKIDTFVKSFDFPKQQPITIIYENDDYNFTYFKVSFGEPQDCYSGCFYRLAQGIKHDEQIGWVYVDNIRNAKVWRGFYDLTEDDYVLASPEFFQKVTSDSEWHSVYLLFRYLFMSQNLPDENYRHLWKSISKNEPTNLCWNFMHNPNVNSNIELLISIKDNLHSCKNYSDMEDWIEKNILRLQRIGDNTPFPIKHQIILLTPQNVVCKEEFQLILKTSNFSPACVKPSTAQKLIERGWEKSE